MSSGKKSISPLRGREYAAAQIMRNSIAHAQYGDSSDALRAQYQLLYNIKLYSCTLRGELIAPEWSDIDLDNMELSISKFAEKTKGKVVTKAPKTRTSYPTVSPPSSVIALAQIQYFRHPVFRRVPEISLIYGLFDMEHTGFEPVASTMRILLLPVCIISQNRKNLDFTGFFAFDFLQHCSAFDAFF